MFPSSRARENYKNNKRKVKAKRKQISVRLNLQLKQFEKYVTLTNQKKGKCGKISRRKRYLTFSITTEVIYFSGNLNFKLANLLLWSAISTTFSILAIKYIEMNF